MNIKLHDRNYRPINVDDFLNPDDADRIGLESCIRGFNKCTCNHCCQSSLIILDAFFDYFLGNLEARKEAVSPLFDNHFLDLLDAYGHLHKGQVTIHCMYNGWTQKSNFANKIDTSK